MTATRSLRPWLSATRPRTLPAAIAPVLAGSALAWHDNGLVLPAAGLCLAFALLVQIGSNYANDYFDFVQGADTPDRIGPTRAVASGQVSASAMKAATTLVLLIAFIVGLGLIPYGGWPLVGVGLASILCAAAYTGGPYPLGYHGLGDPFVFLFFGVIAVNATYYVQLGGLSLSSLLASFGIGALTTNILVVNNFRDVKTDAAAGKRTLAVRYGHRFTKREFIALNGIAAAVPPALVLAGMGPTVLLPWAILPRVRLLYGGLHPQAGGPWLNRMLGRTAQFLLLYALLLSIGIVLSRLLSQPGLGSK